MTTPKSDLPFLTISEDHQELREAIRNVAEDKIALHAAEVDETSTFPQVAGTNQNQRVVMARQLLKG